MSNKELAYIQQWCCRPLEWFLLPSPSIHVQDHLNKYNTLQSRPATISQCLTSVQGDACTCSIIYLPHMYFPFTLTKHNTVPWGFLQPLQPHVEEHVVFFCKTFARRKPFYTINTCWIFVIFSIHTTAAFFVILVSLQQFLYTEHCHSDQGHNL